MKKLLYNLASITSIVMILSLLCFNGFQGCDFNGITLLIIGCLFINPIFNLYRLTTKRIYNLFYNLLVILISIIITYISIKSIANYCMNYNIDQGDSTVLGFFNSLIYMIIAILIIDLLSIFMKKEKTLVKKDNSKLLFLIISITGVLPLLSNYKTIQIILSVALSIFSFIIIFELNHINSKYDLQKVYALLMIISLITMNFVSLILLINMYFELDKYGVNV